MRKIYKIIAFFLGMVNAAPQSGACGSREMPGPDLLWPFNFARQKVKSALGHLGAKIGEMKSPEITKVWDEEMGPVKEALNEMEVAAKEIVNELDELKRWQREICSAETTATSPTLATVVSDQAEEKILWLSKKLHCGWGVFIGSVGCYSAVSHDTYGMVTAGVLGLSVEVVLCITSGVCKKRKTNSSVREPNLYTNPSPPTIDDTPLIMNVP